MKQEITHISLKEHLDRVLNNVDVQALSDARHDRELDPNDELMMFADIDPVLADLLKQYKDAEKQFDFLCSEFSNDDPMADVAQDRKKSAWSAVQTRLLELRKDEKASDQVALRLLRLQEERAGLIPSRLKKEEEAYIVRRKFDERIKKRDRDNLETDFLMFFLWIWLSQKLAEKTCDATQRLQNCFAMAV